MKQIHCRPYEIEDMVAILKETEPEDEPCQRERHIRTAETRRYGPAFSFFQGEELICCAGATVYWPGCAEVWLAPAKCWPKYIREVAIWTRKVLDDLQNNFGLTRIQADVVAEDEKARRFVEHYKFVCEGRMRKYDVLGRDCLRYARVK